MRDVCRHFLQFYDICQMEIRPSPCSPTKEPALMDPKDVCRIRGWGIPQAVRDEGPSRITRGEPLFYQTENVLSGIRTTQVEPVNAWVLQAEPVVLVTDVTTGGLPYGLYGLF